MKLRLTKAQGQTTRRIDRYRERARNLLPAARKFGEFVTREARRKAPRGTGVMRRQAAGLANSLAHFEPLHNVTVLSSPLPYARIQNTGGTITAGAGPLKSKYLVIPLSDVAERYLGFLGAGTSLRNGPIQLLVLKYKGQLWLARRVDGRQRGGFRVDRRGRTRARRQIFDVGGGQGRIEFLFLLRKRVRIKGSRYAPSFRDPAVRAFAARTVERYLRTGQA